MRIENINFVEAVEELGVKLGIAVPKASRSGPSKDDKNKLNQIMLLAAKYFQANLGKAANNYLKKRGISEKTRNLFGLGFSLPAWDGLFKHLVSRGAAPNLIEKTGLILARESSSGYYDRFRNRLIFPIIDHRNRVVAFGGRSLGDEEPKYLNSPETVVYHKGETLYGLNLAKESIKQSKTAVLVEGYFDLITPFQAGITNMVASLGTALTVLHCKLLARYSETVILAFDADSAGGVAAERSVEILRQQGLKVKIAEITAAKDPDGLIQKRGAGAFRACLASALPYLEFKIKRILSRHNLKEIESRSKALQAIALLLSKEKDSFIQKEYTKLAANLLKTDTDTLSTEIKRFHHYQTKPKTFSKRTTEKPRLKIIEAEKNLIAIAAQNKEALNVLKGEMAVENFTARETQVIAKLLLSTDFSKIESPFHFLLENLSDEKAKQFLSRLLLSEHLSQKENETILKDCIEVIKKEQVKKRIDALKLEIKEAEKAGETSKVSKLLSTLKSEIS